ncbi:hypothetical protein S40293_07682 [Stachybotrys chartarum IBT 40293]|nr:hypothetical protein S40293_07682 [Stachybotrys chartarum IBT 40293]
MASRPQPRKRRISPEVTSSADELDGLALDGVLSQSDDDSDDERSDSAHTKDTPPGVANSLGTTTKGNGFSLSNKLSGSQEVANYTVVSDANGNERFEYDEVDPVYDSDDSDAQEATNTIGNIPLSFYDSYPHIGYDINGKKIMRPATGEALDSLLNSIELPKGWTGLTDPQTGLPLNLSQSELELLRRIQMNEITEEGYDPYPELVPYFTSIEEQMPLSAAPEPKRRFVPSKHEAKRVAKLVRAIREGRILPYKPPADREAEEETDVAYDIWVNEEPQDRHVMNIPAPKLAPPGYDLSYNPPPEYLPSADEKRAWESTDPEDREKDYLPARFDSLRKVPGYGEFVKERFERCLDLYLAPRIRKNRLNIDPDSLLPKLPSPQSLKPFPTLCQTIFRGHEGRVRTASFSPDGEWVASGGDDGTVRVWALNGHQEWQAKIHYEEPVNVVRWRPANDGFILAAAAGEDLFFIVPPLVSDAVARASRELLDAGFGHAATRSQVTAVDGVKKDSPAKWQRPGSKLEDMGVLLKATVRATIKAINWHRRGDFLCTVSPTGQRSSVAIHTLSKHLSQIPFRRLPGLAQTALFHPLRPLFFVATQRTIRCYDLQRQELIKVVQPGARWISSFDVHPGGDNLIVGSYDRRLLWHDLDLSTRPYKTMRFHAEAIRAVKYHRSLPLFADASDDGTLQIFHGKVVNDLMESATIVPVKMLKGHKVVNKLGIMDMDWHPRHPWCLSAGADGTCRLWA